jgi:hypothetical protein
MMAQVAGNTFGGSNGTLEPPDTPSRKKGLFGLNWKWSGASMEDDIFGKKWVEVHNTTGSR